ncbi:MAG: hypothetical protein Q9218_002252 [Villophora microphyllina]
MTSDREAVGEDGKPVDERSRTTDDDSSLSSLESLSPMFDDGADTLAHHVGHPTDPSKLHPEPEDSEASPLNPDGAAAILQPSPQNLDPLSPLPVASLGWPDRLTSKPNSVAHLPHQDFGQSLGHSYVHVSQAIASSNSLYKTPGLVSQQRAQAMRFEVHENSLMRGPLHIFLAQSADIDEDLVRLMLASGEMGELFDRQQQQTTALLLSVQGEHWYMIEILKIRLQNPSTIGKLVQDRLRDHLELLSNEISSVEEKNSRMLQRFISLTHTTEAIRDAAINDQKRLLAEKNHAASNMNWVGRSLVALLHLPESSEMAQISKNVKGAQEIHAWSEGVVSGLQRGQSQLKFSKVYIADLEQKIQKYSVIGPPDNDRDRHVLEFLAQVSSGAKAVEANTDAWRQMRLAGHL